MRHSPVAKQSFGGLERFDESKPMILPLSIERPSQMANLVGRVTRRWSVPNFRHSNHRIGAHACTNHTVPYGTALLGGAVPGTSCQATIARSLRDISQQALASDTAPPPCAKIETPARLQGLPWVT